MPPRSARKTGDDVPSLWFTSYTRSLVTLDEMRIVVHSLIFGLKTGVLKNHLRNAPVKCLCQQANGNIYSSYIIED